jgi:hypothetical protein
VTVEHYQKEEKKVLKIIYRKSKLGKEGRFQIYPFLYE